MEKGKISVGLIDKIKIMRMYKGMYARLCSRCREKLVKLTLEQSRGGRVPMDKNFIDKCMSITCSNCKGMIRKYMESMLEIVKSAKEK